MGAKAERALDLLIERQAASGMTDQEMADAFGWKAGKSWEHLKARRIPVTRAFLAQALVAYSDLGPWLYEAIIELAIERGATAPGAALS